MFEPLTLCVSGFAGGNFVTIIVSWLGTPGFHSTYTLSQYVGATGGFSCCAPPSWATMSLTPGSYTVQALEFLKPLGYEAPRSWRLSARWDF